MPLDFKNHPCFNKDMRKKTGRIHLPVAPKCNVKCNFCDRKYDCLNESRPGVTSAVLSPGQAMSYLAEAMEKTPNIRVVGIAGPGDPFANPDETMETLRRVRAAYPDMLLCVATNGLNLTPYVPELAELKVSHITLTINGVDPEISSSVYGWIRHGKRVYHGSDIGPVMLDNQMAAVEAIKKHNILLKINTIVMPGINDHHIEEISETLAAKGADIQNCMALCRVDGTPFEYITPPSTKQLVEIRKAAGTFIDQMTHCARCRADAAGLIGNGISDDLKCALQEASAKPIEPEQKRPYIAISSREGVLVNQHLGEAEHLWIFGPGSHGGAPYQLIASRPAPEPGGGSNRWQKMADSLDDCRTLLCSGAGSSPTSVLNNNGIEVVMMNGMITEALEAVYTNKPVRAPIRKHRCGTGCGGDGLGCS